jgi:hypothetical protein
MLPTHAHDLLVTYYFCFAFPCLQAAEGALLLVRSVSQGEPVGADWLLALLANCHVLVSYLACSSTLKMEKMFLRNVVRLSPGCTIFAAVRTWNPTQWTRGLFTTAVSISGCIISDDRLINEHWVGRDMEGSGLGVIWDTVPAFSWWDCRNV